MDFKILDASAFYAGIPFHSLDRYYTTSLVYDEIKHIKEKQDALGALLNSKRLEIKDPLGSSLEQAQNAAKQTGDFPQLSKQDISVIALAIELDASIVSDDYAISNVAQNLGLGTIPLMTRGIKDVGKWKHYCPACKTTHDNKLECPTCGTALKRKLLKR